MTDPTYIPLDEIIAADLANCGDGLFQSMRQGTYANVLVTTFGQTRYAVYLDDPSGVIFVPAPVGEASTRLGILWPKPTIEVDPTTFYDPARADELPGDIVLGPNPMICAREPNGWFNDGQRTPLWGGEDASGKPVAFRSWRLTSVVGDRRRVIYTRTKPSE